MDDQQIFARKRTYCSKHSYYTMSENQAQYLVNEVVRKKKLSNSH